MAWSFNLITQTLTPATDRMPINAVALMEVLWAQVYTQCHLYLVHTLQQLRRVTLCHPLNIYRRMTNCSQRTGECLGEQEIKLFILRKPFS